MNTHTNTHTHTHTQINGQLIFPSKHFSFYIFIFIFFRVFFHFFSFKQDSELMTHTHTIMYHKHQMIMLRIFPLFTQAQLPMVEMLITCSVKRDFARLCRPLIPIASDPRQRLSTLKSDILILHSRKQVPLMQPLVLQFFQRRIMLLRCFHQRTIEFSV